MSTLEEKFKKGDKKAFDELYGKFAQAMYVVCLRYAKTQDAASDIMQDAFIKIYKNRKKYDPKYPIAAWIKRIVINQAINHYRSELKFVQTEDDQLEEKGGGIETTIDGEELKKVLKTALQDLSQGCRTVFNLYTFENLTHKEIAEYLNITTSTSKTQYMKARKLLKKFLDERGITRSHFVHGEKV